MFLKNDLYDRNGCRKWQVQAVTRYAGSMSHAPTLMKIWNKFLTNNSGKKGWFLLVAEEEANQDNFGNDNMNAEGVIGSRKEGLTEPLRSAWVCRPKHKQHSTMTWIWRRWFWYFQWPARTYNREYPVLDANGCIDEPLSYSLDPCLAEQGEQKTQMIDGITDFNIKQKS